MEHSLTAVTVLIARALEQTSPAHALQRDPVAIPLFAGYTLAQAMQQGTAGRNAVDDLIGNAAMRSFSAEAALAGAVQRRGIRQYVILGAGYDTFAYRAPPWACDTRIVEVDHEASQVAKQQALRYGGIAIPANVTFVALDSERAPLLPALLAGGLDVTQPIFFSWLGVTNYLTRPTVEATLREISTLPAGTEIALTYAARVSGNGWAILAAALGEPWLTGFDEGELAELLRSLGYRDISVGASIAFAGV
jgi:methyltransferase (TIGR00027 family)